MINIGASLGAKNLSTNNTLTIRVVQIKKNNAVSIIENLR